MATKSLYFKNVAPSGAATSLSLQDGGTAPTAAVTTTGWTVAKLAANNMSAMLCGTKRASGTFSTSDAIGSFVATACFRSETTFTGTFLNTSWTLAFRIRCATIANQTGAIKVRIWKSSNAAGTGATQLTSAVLTGTTTNALAVVASSTSTVTWSSPGAIALTNEYLWVQCEWNTVNVSSSNSGDALIYVESAGLITTPDFVISTTDAWSLADMSAGITLSAADKTATLNVGTSTYVRSTTTYLANNTGKRYAEFYFPNVSGTGTAPLRVGLDKPNSAGSGNALSCLYYSDGNIYFNQSIIGTNIGTITSGDTICVAWDEVNGRFYFRKNNGPWNGSGAADPSTNTGGHDISGVPTSEVYALEFAGVNASTSNCTIRTEVADLVFQGPTGFTSWMGEVIPTTDAWNVNDKQSQITLANGDKKATASIGFVGVRSTQKRISGSAGLWYAEFKIETAAPADGNNVIVGAMPTTEALDAETPAIRVLETGGNFYGGDSTMDGALGGFVSGDVISFAWDAGGEVYWFRKNNGNWNNNASADPATGTGYATAFGVTGGSPMGLWFKSGGANDSVTIRTEDAEFTQVAPVGFLSWMGETITQPAVDAWNFRDKTAAVTLSGNDKIATASSGVQPYARSTTSRSTGKYYFEFVVSGTLTSVPGVGFKDKAAVLTTFAANSFVIMSNGNWWINGANLASGVGATPVAGDVLSFAWDADAKRCWARLNAGQWENNAGADPAAGTNGRDVSAAGGTDFCLYFASNVSGTVLTARTEKAEFTQITPSGFLSWMGETLVAPDIGTLPASSATLAGFGVSGSVGTGRLNPSDIVLQLGVTPVASGYSFGTTFSERIGQGFAASSASIISVTLNLEKIGAADGVVAQIWSAPPSPAVQIGQDSSVILSSTLTTSLTQRTLTFDPPISVTNGTSYAIVLARTGALSDANYYNAGYESPGTFPSYTLIKYASGSWSQLPTNDLVGSITFGLPGGSYSTIGGFGAVSSVGTGALTAVANSRVVNLILYSQALDNAWWTKSAITCVANTVAAPDATMTAETITAYGGGYHGIYPTDQTSITQGATYTMSFYVKAGTAQWIQYYGESTVYCNFDIVNGVTGNVTGTITRTITNVGNGWYRCSCTYSAPTSQVRPQIYVLATDALDGGGTHAVDNLSIHLWGMQFEKGALGSYVPTSATVGVVAETIVGTGTAAWVASGALVAGTSRTNLVFPSQEFEKSDWYKYSVTIAPDAVVAPDSTTTAETITATAANDTHVVYLAAGAAGGLPNGANYVTSIYAKAGAANWLQIYVGGFWANFNLSSGVVGNKNTGSAQITNAGNGWWRCSVLHSKAGTIQPQFVLLNADDNAVGGNAYAGTGQSFYLWGAQSEDGIVPTAYIPTTTAPASVGAPALLSGAGQVTTPPAFGTGVLTSTNCSAVSFGVSQSVGTSTLTASAALRANTFLYSQAFDNSAWQKFNATITPDVIVAPDGTTTAETLTDNATSGTHYLQQLQGGSTSSEWTYSIHAKAGTGSWLRLYLSINSTVSANFNLATGAIGLVSGSASPTIVALGNGWYRCSVSLLETGGVVTPQALGMPGDQASASYVGSGSTWHLWGAQLEPSATRTRYIPTAGGTVFAPTVLTGDGISQVVATGALVAGSRTNFLRYSQDIDNAWWTKEQLTVAPNAIVAPDGTTTGETITTTTVSGLHRITVGAWTTVPSGNYVVSFYAKAGTGSWIQPSDGVAWANFDVANGILGQKAASATSAIEALGNGWYRCSLMYPKVAGGDLQPQVFFLDSNGSLAASHALALSYHLWGFQNELGTFAAPYIPTTTVPVTVGTPALIAGVGTSQNIGTGVLNAQSNFLQLGSGLSASLGTAPLAAASSIIVAAGGVVMPTGTGTLVAGARSNMFLRSQEFQTAWTPNALTIGIDQIAAPDGTLTADLLTESGDGFHYVLQNTVVVPTGTNTFSVHVKADSRQWMQLIIQPSGSGTYFNVANGTIGTSSSVQNSTIQNLGNGWFRCSITFSGGNVSHQCMIILAKGDNNNNYVGEGSKLYLWGAQFELDDKATAYIQTGNTTVTVGTPALLAGTGTVITPPAVGTGVLTTTVAAATGFALSQSIGTAPLAAASSVVVSSGLSQVAATGVLAASAATTVGPGISQSRSTSATLNAQPNFLQIGSGLSSSTGTAALAPIPATIVSSGLGPSWVGSGVLPSAVATLAGAGVNAWRATGTLPAGVSALAGAGVRAWNATGTMPAQSATTVAPGLSSSAGSGTLPSTVSTMSGLGSAVTGVGGTGALACFATAAGAGISSSASTSAILTSPAVSIVAPGVSQSFGTAVLPRTGTTTAALTSAGKSEALGTAALADQAAIIVSAGVAQHVAIGTLPAGVSSIVSAGLARWVATIAALNVGVSAAAGAGVSRSVSTSTALLASVASASGFEGVTIVSGTGTLPAQSHALAAVGVSRSLGTGALSLTGATLAGAGLSGSTGTPSLASQACVISGVGRVNVDGFGTLAVGMSALAGLGGTAAAPTGTGVLASQVSVVAGAGVRQWIAIGALSAQASTVAGAAQQGWIATGALASGAASAAGAGLARWAATGAVAASAAAVVGAGVSSSAGTAPLLAARASVYGYEGTVVIEGSGDLQAQSRLIVSSGTSRSLGTGSLVVVDSAEAVGVGVSRSLGTSALTTVRSDLEGLGTTQALGTGALATTAAISGTGTARWLATGTLSGQVSSLAGVSISQSRGNGVLQDGVASLAAVGSILTTGTGALASKPATIFGSAFLSTQGAGELEAQSRVVAGLGTSQSRGTGVLVEARPTIAGVSVSGAVGTGVINSRRALMLGFAVETAFGSGDLVTTNATITGSNLAEGSGVIDAAVCEIVGVGTMGEPQWPAPPDPPGSYPGTVTWYRSGALVSAPTLPPPAWWLGKEAA